MRQAGREESTTEQPHLRKKESDTLYKIQIKRKLGPQQKHIHLHIPTESLTKCQLLHTENHHDYVLSHLQGESEQPMSHARYEHGRTY